jgi:hypothetical protein
MTNQEGTVTVIERQNEVMIALLARLVWTPEEKEENSEARCNG